MTRPPLEDQPLSAAERQRRHRARLRHRPWMSRRKTFEALVLAIRDLQRPGEGDEAPVLSQDQVDALVAATIERLEIPSKTADLAVDEAGAYLSALFDPVEHARVERRRGRHAVRREHGRIGRRLHGLEDPKPETTA
ncbi:MAG: hypothetical protein KC466_20430 [Myxococcales bacterium]|nr:hypothetical protein [Myxococcales bacterium]